MRRSRYLASGAGKSFLRRARNWRPSWIVSPDCSKFEMKGSVGDWALCLVG